MDWENIGKASVMLISSFAGVGLIYLIIRIVAWKWHVDSEIEAQATVNEKVLKALDDIKVTVKETISEKRSEE